jgi:hypothetical protein
VVNAAVAYRRVGTRRRSRSTIGRFGRLQAETATVSLPNLYCKNEIPGVLLVDQRGEPPIDQGEEVQFDWEHSPSGQDGCFYRAIRIIRQRPEAPEATLRGPQGPARRRPPIGFSAASAGAISQTGV